MSLKEAKSDEFFCESVAKSISEIIRFSLDEEFRKSSFKLFGVSSTKETEREISKRLMSIIENTSRPSCDKTRKRKKLNEEKDNENLKEQKDAKNKNQPSNVLHNCKSQSSNPQILPQNFFGKNWLQISSQQYRDVVKRRKLHYFSQPQFSQVYERDINNESSNCKICYNNSQPTSSVSYSPTNESIQSSHKHTNSSAYFSQKMFNVSFKDNVQKYLKENSNFHKHFGF